MCGNLFCNPWWPLGCRVGYIPIGYGAGCISESEQAHMPAESALEILKKRYARGEINKEEFEEKKKDLV